MSIPASIDAVYTWVDGQSPEYAALVRRYADRPEDMNPERFRDTFDLLRYSLRALEQHAPWVRNVYLFTVRPQAPAWLRRDHPRLRIVHHDEVITDPEVLPTFNSNVIELYLDRLPGLSEDFLYLNDDYLLGAPVTPADFYAADGRMRVFGTVAGEVFRRRVYQQQWLSLGLLEHGPLLIRQSLWRDMLAGAADEIAQARLHRFRTDRDLRPDRLYRWYLLRHARDRAVAEPCWRYLRHAAFHKIKGGVDRERVALAGIARRRPKFICLNDDQGDRADPRVAELVREFLERLYPRPSSYERAERNATSLRS